MTNKLMVSFTSGGIGTLVGITEMTSGATELNAILGIILTVLSIISITISTVIVIMNKVKEAKKDGKITIDEVVDIAKDVKDGVDKISDIVDKNKPKGDK